MKFILRLSHILCLLVFFSFYVVGIPADREITFFQISIEDGLSQSTVFDIAQDKLGNLWVATADGLNRYDGYRFTVYRHEEGNEESIQSDYMRALYMMDEDRLMIGGKRGLTIYDIKRNVFTNYPLDKEIHQITQVSDFLYYMIGLTDVYTYDAALDELTLVHSVTDMQLYTIRKWKEGVLIGSTYGLHSYCDAVWTDVDLSIDALVQDICETAEGVWLATEGKGLFFWADSDELRNYMPEKGNDKSLISANVRRLELDSYNRLWVGTMEGLSIYDKETNSFDCYSSNPVKEGWLSHNSIRSMFLDNQGGMWLGTYFGGLNYYHPLQNQFAKMSHIPFSNSLSDNIISCIVEGEADDIWIGTNDEGLNRYHVDTGIFDYYSTANVLLSNNIKAVLVDNGYVYVGSHGGGMTRLHIRTGGVKHYTLDNSKIGSNDVYSFMKDVSGNIWIATLNGLKIFNPLADVFYSISDFKPIGNYINDFVAKLSSIQVYTLYKDSRNRVWIGSELGIYTFFMNNSLLVHYDIGSAKKNERINCFLEDSSRKIWIGMQSGLGALDENSQQVRIYNTADGLPNNNVYGILEDDYNRLWISTNKGLACITPDFSKIRLYTLKDGIQSDQFNNYAYAKMGSGEMYFGGINGLIHFFPEHLIDNPYAARAVISELRVSNAKVLPGDETGILNRDISYTDRIRLKPTQNSFSLLLTVPNYLSMKHNVFAYKLDGVDDEWLFLSESHPVIYSNLDPGKYTFEVKAGNRDDRWNEEVRTLEVVVLPFWWDTPIFRTALFLLLVVVGYLIVRFYANRQKLKNQLVLEKLEQEKQEEINQTKLRFFINMSHEFRTPLTLIISPLKELLENTPDRWIRKQLEIVVRNANKLMYLVDQLMDYRKADLGVFALKVTENNITEQIREQMELFDRAAKQKDIDFVYRNELEESSVLYDANYIDLIVSNLLSNAFKFTPQEGTITIVTRIENGNLLICISDTGTGMKEEDCRRVFERFFQANSEVKGTGVGLSLVKRLIELHHADIRVDSRLGEGTCFTITIPQARDVYTDREFAQEGEDVATVYKDVSDDKIELFVQNYPEDSAEGESHEDTKKAVILIVEDDPDVRSYLVDSFREMAVVEKADNGKSALELINEKAVDLVITDIMLPVMDGRALCKAIKQNIKTCCIPVIMLTAKSTDEDKVEGFIAGADSYISKPFDISLLKIRARNMLQAKQRILKYYSTSLEVEPEKLTFNELDREFLKKAKAIVETNMDNINFSVDDFCKEMAMSRSNLHLKMKAITGESTIEFIRKIRFNEACKLLKDGRYSITEISTMVGFNTASYFTTSFKKYFGVLPTDYGKR